MSIPVTADDYERELKKHIEKASNDIKTGYLISNGRIHSKSFKDGMNAGLVVGVTFSVVLLPPLLWYYWHSNGVLFY